MKYTNWIDVATVDLIFVPMYDNGEYYIVCINFISRSVQILADFKLDSLYKKSYEKAIKMLIKVLSNALKKMVKKTRDIGRFKIVEIEPPWITASEPSMDSGIFCMRHMKMYEGHIRGRILGFKKDNDFVLNRLRSKYLYRLLTPELNILRDELMHRVADAN